MIDQKITEFPKPLIFHIFYLIISRIIIIIDISFFRIKKYQNYSFIFQMRILSILPHINLSVFKYSVTDL